MEREEIKQILVNIISQVAVDEDTSNLQDDVPIREQLELDSMDFLDIILSLKKKHSLEIPKEDFDRIKTINGFVDYFIETTQQNKAA
ncbi:MAG: acyl carrier protein [Bacteriovoracaceae bacterium]|nr:acyl carrier protein [Bacteriovoracaceae bacterium]